MATDDPTAREGQYRIGTVAQLTGLTADTIRMWERRYRTLRPQRTRGGTRLYSDDDVARLRLMRTLTAAGDAISKIANLSTDSLRDRLRRLGGSRGAATTGTATALRLAVLDPDLAEQIRHAAAPGVEVECEAGDLETLWATLAATRVDALALRLDRLGSEPHAAVRRCQEIARARVVLVVYEFAQRRVLAQLAEQGAKLLRAPLGPGALRQALTDLAAIAEVERRAHARDAKATQDGVEPGVPPRRFSDEQLARLGRVAGSTACECARQGAVLVARMNACEEYARKCVDAGREVPLHSDLHRTAARARAQVESLLDRMLKREGLEL